MGLWTKLSTKEQNSNNIEITTELTREMKFVITNRFMRFIPNWNLNMFHTFHGLNLALVPNDKDQTYIGSLWYKDSFIKINW